MKTETKNTWTRNWFLINFEGYNSIFTSLLGAASHISSYFSFVIRVFSLR